MYNHFFWNITISNMSFFGLEIQNFGLNCVSSYKRYVLDFKCLFENSEHFKSYCLKFQDFRANLYHPVNYKMHFSRPWNYVSRILRDIFLLLNGNANFFPNVELQVWKHFLCLNKNIYFLLFSTKFQLYHYVASTCKYTYSVSMIKRFKKKGPYLENVACLTHSSGELYNSLHFW